MSSVKKAIFSNQLTPPVGPYSQAVQLGNMLFLSGQIAPDKIDEGIRSEAEAVMKNLNILLQEAGYTFSDVVKTTILLSDMSLFSKVNEVYASFFDAQSILPARETFAVRALPKGVNVEISAIAIKSSS